MENEQKTEEPKVADPKVELPEETAAVVTKKRPGRPVAIKDEAVNAVKNPKVEIVLKNTRGEDVPSNDYFYKGIVPAGFAGTCGRPVDREDLIEVFHKVFKPSDNILFYKQLDREVYIIMVPLRYATEVGDSEDSLDGDFQKHAISFLNEGSVNIDTMKQKLEKINNFVNYSDR